MAEKIAVELGDAQTTLLIPLLARAVETQKQRGLLKDTKAVEIVESLDYDFSHWNDTPSLIGSNMRTLMFDQMVAAFMTQHPQATVVEIGCGLNTRFERLDNGQIHWFDLDLPDVIALRQQFFNDTDRRTMLAASVLDTQWMQQVKQSQGPYFFVSEAAIIYLETTQAEQAIAQIATHFKGASIAFDTTDSFMVENQAKHDAMRHLSAESWFKWKCDDPQQLTSLAENLTLVESKTFFDADSDILNNTPLSMRIVMRYFPFLIRRKLNHYRLNLFHA